MKWLALIAAILLTLETVSRPLGSLGALAGGLYVAFALLHIWSEWLAWSKACRDTDHPAKSTETPTVSEKP